METKHGQEKIGTKVIKHLYGVVELEFRKVFTFEELEEFKRLIKNLYRFHVYPVVTKD